jgi:hypothetical protein
MKEKRRKGEGKREEKLLKAREKQERDDGKMKDGGREWEVVDCRHLE